MVYTTAPWKVWEWAKKARSKQLKEGPEAVKDRGGYLVFGSVINDCFSQRLQRSSGVEQDGCLL